MRQREFFTLAGAAVGPLVARQDGPSTSAPLLTRTAAICLIGCVAMTSRVFAQELSPLPPVIGDPPERLRDIGVNPKPGLDRGRRAQRNGPGNPASIARVASVANAVGTSAAAVPATSS